MYVVPGFTPVILAVCPWVEAEPAPTTVATSVFRLWYVQFPDSISFVNRLKPALALTFISFVSPCFNVINFSFTSSLGLLIHPTNFEPTFVSFPNSPFVLYPTVHTVPSYFTKVVWLPLLFASITLSKFPSPLSFNTCLGTFIVVVLFSPNCPY